MNICIVFSREIVKSSQITGARDGKLCAAAALPLSLAALPLSFFLFQKLPLETDIDQILSNPFYGRSIA